MSRLRITIPAVPALAARPDRRTLLSALLIVAYGFACLIGVTVGLLQGSGEKATLVVVTPRDLTPGTPGAGETPGGTAPPFGTQAVGTPFGTPVFGTPPGGTAGPGESGPTTYPGPGGGVLPPPGSSPPGSLPSSTSPPVASPPLASPTAITPPVQASPPPTPLPTAGLTITLPAPVTATAPAGEGTPTPTPATSPYPGSGTPDQNPTAPGGVATATPSPGATNVQGLSVTSSGHYVDTTGTLTVMGEVRNNSGRPATEVVVAFVLYDASNYVLGRESAFVVLPFVLNGETAPFWTALEAPLTLDHVGNFVVTQAESISAATPIDLKLVNSTTREESGLLIISGAIQNTGTTNLNGVYLYALIFDSAGQPRRWSEGEPDLPNLIPQQQSTFELSADALAQAGQVRIYWSVGQ